MSLYLQAFELSNTESQDQSALSPAMQLQDKANLSLEGLSHTRVPQLTPKRKRSFFAQLDSSSKLYNEELLLASREQGQV